MINNKLLDVGLQSVKFAIIHSFWLFNLVMVKNVDISELHKKRDAQK